MYLTILIFDPYPFYHVSLKFRKFQENLYVFDVMPNNFRCTYWRRDCCIFYPAVHIQESNETARPNSQRISL